MAAWLARRVAAAIAGVWAVVTLTFFLIHLAPGSPFPVPGQERPMDPAVTAELRRRFGLDRPLPVQYLSYLRELGRGNLGVSFGQRRPVAEALGDAIPNTLLLAGAALCIDLLLGLALGVYQAAHVHRRSDVLLGNLSLFIGSMPTFWLGLGALLVFGQRLHWFPIGGTHDPVVYASLSWLGKVGDRLWHLALPALTLGLVAAAGTARYQRSAMLEALCQDFVRTARAKGVPPRQVLLHHVLRNALLPGVTLFGLAFPFLLTGAVLTESIFAWPGMGRLAAEAISTRDYPLINATTLVAAVMVAAGSLIADLLLAAVDPRVRVSDA